MVAEAVPESNDIGTSVAARPGDTRRRTGPACETTSTSPISPPSMSRRCAGSRTARPAGCSTAAPVAGPRSARYWRPCGRKPVTVSRSATARAAPATPRSWSPKPRGCAAPCTGHRATAASARWCAAHSPGKEPAPVGSVDTRPRPVSEARPAADARSRTWNIVGSTKIRGVKRRDHLPSEGRAGV